MGLFRVDLAHVSDQIQNLVAVAPLVIIPGNQLEEVGIQRDAGGGIVDGGAGIRIEIGGNHRILGVAQNPMKSWQEERFRQPERQAFTEAADRRIQKRQHRGDVSWIRMGHPFVIPEENGGEMWFWIR